MKSRIAPARPPAVKVCPATYVVGNVRYHCLERRAHSLHRFAPSAPQGGVLNTRPGNRKVRSLSEVMSNKEKLLAGKQPFYIIWNPHSPAAPTAVFGTEETAEMVAAKMALDHRDVFFVMKSVVRKQPTKPRVRSTRVGK